MKKVFFGVMAALLLQACATTNAPFDYKQDDSIVVINHLDDTFMIQWAGFTVFDSAKDTVELGYSRSKMIADFIKSKSRDDVYFSIEDLPKDGGTVHYLHIENSEECAGAYCSYYLPGSGVYGNNFNRWGMSTLVFTLTDQPQRSADETRTYFKKARVRANIKKKKIKKKADPKVFSSFMQCLDKKNLELALYHINESMPVFNSVAIPEGKHMVKAQEVVILDTECLSEL